MSQKSYTALEISEIPRLDAEYHLQRIVKNLSHMLIFVPTKSITFAKFLKTLDECEGLDDILAILADLTEYVASELDRKAAYTHKIQQLKKSKKELTKGVLTIPEYVNPREEYESLERLLQRHEAEIRSHIRVQQQLKIYIEELEQEIHQARQRQHQIAEIQAQNHRLTTELNEIKSGNLLSLSKVISKASNAKETPLSKIRPSSDNQSKEKVI